MGPTPGGMQINASAIRMAMEIDHAMKLLAQAVPSLGPWVAKTTMELKAQLGQVLNAPPMMSGPDASFPDGSSRL